MNPDKAGGKPQGRRQRPKTTRADIQAGICEERPWTPVSGLRGRIKTKCPFCKFTAYLTSFSLGSGKRCVNPFCGAMFTKERKAYRKEGK